MLTQINFGSEPGGYSIVVTEDIDTVTERLGSGGLTRLTRLWQGEESVVVVNPAHVWTLTVYTPPQRA
jgi:hypothetical protein